MGSRALEEGHHRAVNGGVHGGFSGPGGIGTGRLGISQFRLRGGLEMPHSFTEHLPEFGAELGARTSSRRLLYKSRSGSKPMIAAETAQGCRRTEEGMLTVGGGRKGRRECHRVAEALKAGIRNVPLRTSALPHPASSTGVRSCPYPLCGDSRPVPGARFLENCPLLASREHCCAPIPCVENMLGSQVPSP